VKGEEEKRELVLGFEFWVEAGYARGVLVFSVSVSSFRASPWLVWVAGANSWVLQFL